MKKKTLISNWKLLITLLLLLSAARGFSQSAYNCLIDNIVYPTPSTLEFDIMIRNTGTTSLQLQTFQMGLEFNYTAMAGAGTITSSWVPGSSTALLPVGFQDLTAQAANALGAALVTSGYRQIRLAAKTGVGSANGIVIPATYTKYATMRLTHSATFPPGVTSNFIWSFNTAAGRMKTNLTCNVNGNSIGTILTTQGIGSGGTPHASAASSPYNYIAGPQHFVVGNPVCTCGCTTVTLGTVTDPFCFEGAGTVQVNLSPASDGTYSLDGGTAIPFTSGTSFTITTDQGPHTLDVTPTGCAAPTTLNFTIGGPNSNATNTVNVAACDAYFWTVNGATYTESGTFNGNSINQNGCPVYETLNLTINSSSSSTTNATACDTYRWVCNGSTFTQSGSYICISTNSVGCENVETLDLTMNNSTSNTTSATTCDTYLWSVNGMTYSQSGTYTATSLNNAGCMHTEVLNLTINNSTSNITNVAACETYTWGVNGMTYALSDTYTATSLNAAGCAHTELLNLIVSLPTSNTINTTSCGSFTWPVNGITYTESGLYTSTSLSPNGCTHTEILDLIILNSTINIIAITACDSYEWAVNAVTYTMSGSYTVTSTNPFGCTHTETLYLTISNSTSNTTNTSACESYTWSVNGITYTLSDTYTATSLNAAGCAHTETLNLIVNLPTLNTINITSCDAFTWPVNEETYTQAGIYTSTSINSGGCTHTEILELIINNSTSNITTVTACDAYEWGVNETTYTMSGTYTVSSANPVGCTHTEILNLTINNSTSNSTHATACESYTWAVNGMVYTQSGTYTSTSVNATGCTHTETLNLTINSSTTNTSSATACDTYTWSVNSTTYTMSGTYTFTYVNTAGCTNTEILNLTINASTSNTSAAAACGSYTWACNSETYNASGAYTCTSINAAGCTHTETLDLAISPPFSACPASTIRTVGSGLCTYEVQDIEFDMLLNLCPGNYTVSYSLVGATIGSGSGPWPAFSLNGVNLNRGINAVTWTITDVSSNQVWACAFEVEVKDDLNSTNYIIYAKEKAEFGEYNSIGGDVGVTASNGQSKFKKNTVLDPFKVTAKNIDVSLPSSVNNRVYISAAGGPTPAFMPYNGSTSGLANLSVSSNGTVSGNYNDLTIKKAITCTITGNNFGFIKIEEGACVTFTSSVINIEKLEVKKGKKIPYVPTKVMFSNPTTVKVKDRVKVESDCLVNEGGPKVTYYLGSSPGQDGNFEVEGENTKVTANVVIPKGELKVKGGNDVTRSTFMKGWYVIEKVKSEDKYIYWNPYQCGTGLKPSEELAAEVVEESVDVYPNPTSSELNVGFNVNELTITMVKVIDMSGRVVKQIQYTAQEGMNTITMNISDLNTGVYTLQLSSKDKVMHVTRIVKN